MKSDDNRPLWEEGNQCLSAPGDLSAEGCINVSACRSVLFTVPCGYRSGRWLRTCECVSAAGLQQCVCLTSSEHAWRKHRSGSSAAEGSLLPPEHPPHHLQQQHTVHSLKGHITHNSPVSCIIEVHLLTWQDGAKILESLLRYRCVAKHDQYNHDIYIFYILTMCCNVGCRFWFNAGYTLLLARS